MTTPDERYGAALWYAWGRIDSGEYRGHLGTDDGFAFAHAQREAQRAYNDGQTHWLESILAAWSTYAETHGGYPDADTVQAAGLDPTTRDHGRPVTWAQVEAAHAERDRGTYYAISARVERLRDGYTSVWELPTFYLHSHPQGILSEPDAERVARTMLREAVNVDDPTITAIHVTAVAL